MSCCTRRCKAAATAGAVRKSMSATHMGSTLGIGIHIPFDRVRPAARDCSSKSYFMRNCICSFMNPSEPPRKFHSGFRFCTAGRLPLALAFRQRTLMLADVPLYPLPYPYRHAMRGNEKRGSRKLPRFLFLASGDFPFGLLAVRRGLEPLTPCVTGTYSNQLN